VKAPGQDPPALDVPRDGNPAGPETLEWPPSKGADDATTGNGGRGCGQPQGDRGKPGTRLERHGPASQGAGREDARAEHSGRCAETRCESKGQLGTQQEPPATERSGEGLGRGNPRELVRDDSDVAVWNSRSEESLEVEESSATAAMLRSPRTNDEEAGSLVTGSR